MAPPTGASSTSAIKRLAHRCGVGALFLVGGTLIKVDRPAQKLHYNLHLFFMRPEMVALAA